MRWLLVSAVLLAASYASACEPKGKPIFRVRTSPIVDHPVPLGRGPVKTVIEIFADGAWTLSPEGREAIGGCIEPDLLGLLKKAIARARFKNVRAPTCRALPTVDVVYEAPRRKLRVATAESCGAPIDDGTALAGGCARALTDSREREPRAACRDDEVE